MGGVARHAGGGRTKTRRSAHGCPGKLPRFHGSKKNARETKKPLPTKCHRRERVQQRLAVFRERRREATARSCPGRLGRSRTGPALAIASGREADRKSTRLNSSHGYISYAVFCLKKKKKQNKK